VYNGIPSTTNAAADFAIGQANLTTNTTTDADFTIQSDYLKAPTDVLLHNNHLYISDTGYHRVLVFNTVPTIVDQKPNLIIGHSAANNILPNRGLPVAAEGLNYPTNLTAVGNTLAVADRDNHRALLYNLPITANAEAAQKVLGQSTMNANMPGVGQGQFNQPNGIFFDGGFMWVVDSLDHRVQVVAIP
ncbi:MAG TPA: hypothetical protein PLY93_11770, partial [Turneriella sp.]|nr:hypothetical protein [Turneriella sp.]